MTEGHQRGVDGGRELGDAEAGEGIAQQLPRRRAHQDFVQEGQALERCSNHAARNRGRGSATVMLGGTGTSVGSSAAIGALPAVLRANSTDE